MWGLLLVIALIVALFFGGVQLIRGSWQPFKDEEGNPVPFTQKEQWTIGGLIAAMVIGIFAIFLATNHPWLKKMKGMS